MRVATSPMNVGSWSLTGHGPQARLAAAALISNTAAPTWHDGYRELPFLFAGSSAVAVGGMGCWPRR